MIVHKVEGGDCEVIKKEVRGSVPGSFLVFRFNTELQICVLSHDGTPVIRKIHENGGRYMIPEYSDGNVTCNWYDSLQDLVAKDLEVGGKLLKLTELKMPPRVHADLGQQAQVPDATTLEIAELRKQLEQVMKIQHEDRKQIKELHDEIRQLRNENQEAKEKYEKEMADKDQEAKEKYEKEMADKDQEIKDLKLSLKDAGETLEVTMTRNSSYINENTKLELKIEELELKIEELEAKLAAHENGAE